MSTVHYSKPKPVGYNHNCSRCGAFAQQCYDVECKAVFLCQECYGKNLNHKHSEEDVPREANK